MIRPRKKPPKRRTKKAARKKKSIKDQDFLLHAGNFVKSLGNLLIRNIHIIIALILVVVAFKVLYGVLLRSEYFTLKSVEVLRLEDDNELVADSGVTLKLEKGLNIFEINLRKCQKQIELAHPEFMSVKVDRVLPDKIIVTYKKRKPICQIKTTRYYLVSHDAVVLPEAYKEPQPGLPIIRGIYISEKELPKDRKIRSPAIRRVLKLIGQIDQTDFTDKYGIEEIDMYDEYNPLIRLDNGIQIKVGKQNFVKRKAALVAVLDELESKGLRPKFIDLRFDDIIVSPR